MKIDWLILSYQVLGGLALFLFGMEVMTRALKDSTGNKLKLFLHRMTSTRWKGLVAGAGITAIIQSSSVTTVLAVGFVSAGLMTFKSTLGVILGADIGTTITAQIIAFKVTQIALLLVIIGYIIFAISNRKNNREYGKIILGLGLIFLGMNFMSEGVQPLKSYTPFIHTMHDLSNPLLGIALGTFFTALIQSSSATTGIVIILASNNFITCEGGISIVIGANIGTCVTAFLSAIGKPRAAIQVAIAHILFKIAGALIWAWFIPQLAYITELITPNDLPRQIANAHTIFNVSNAAWLIGLTTPVALFINKIFPVKQKTEETEILLLDKYYLQHTSLAIDLVDKELEKFSILTKKLMENALPVILKGNKDELQQLRLSDKDIDEKQQQILSYLQQIQQAQLGKKEVARIKSQMETTNILEIAADLITTDMVEAAEHRIDLDFHLSEDTILQLDQLYNICLKTLFDSFPSSSDNKSKRSDSTIPTKKLFKRNIYTIKDRLADRLSLQDKNRIAIIRFETEITEIISHLYSLAHRLTKMQE